ncbi:MAG TPA: hypothetical protein VMK65_00950 [Longimicrobiales bacterium]|nr:hypothetical protein [Longimicrobiales bacterium]
MRNHPLLALCATLALGLSACGDDEGPAGPGGGDDAASGTIAFDFSGDRSGRFTATGVAPDDSADTAYGTWSTAARSATELVVVGSRARTAPRVDLVFLVLSEVSGPGTYAIDPLGGGPGLGIVLFDVDADATEVDTQAATYVLTSGSVTLEALTAERARGSFSGDAVRLEGSQRLFVTGGNFDVPVREEDFAAVTSVAGAPAPR